MLPAFEFGYAEGHDVGIEKSATPLQHGKESAIDFGDRGLERFGVGAPRERQRFPPGLSEVLLFPRAIELGSIAGGNQSFQSGRKSAQPPNRLHAGNVESAAILRYPNSRLNLARSCAGAGHFSRRFSRLPPAPVVAAVAPLSWGSPVRSRSPAASRCCMRPSSRSARSMRAAGSEDSSWCCARQNLGARRVGVIYLDDDYGRGLRLSFTAEFKQLGGEIVEEDPMLGNTPRVEPYLSRLRQAGGVDALMLATDRNGAELALREMSRLGVHWTTIGGDALTGIESDGALSEGVRMSIGYLVDQAGDRNAQFVASYARAYPGERPDHRGAAAYDIVQLLAAVMTEAGTDRRAIRDRVARTGKDLPPYDGVTGRIAFDDKGDVPTKPVVIGTVRAGKLTPELSGAQ